jgi:MYXO-CTERM domain-containing protein
MRWAPLAVALALCAAGASAAGLLHQSDLHYVGSFRLPTGTQGGDHFDYSSGFMAGNVFYDPTHGNAPTLFISGYLASGYVSSSPSLAQISIPALLDPGQVGLDGLNTANVLQGFADPSNGMSPLTGNGFCSYVVYSGSLVGTCSVAYDASGLQDTAVFLDSSLNLSAPSVSGPWALGTVSQTLFGSYMTLVPPEWQSALGAKVVAGNAPWSIISRNSAGPGLHTVDVDAVLTKPATSTVIASTPLAYYPCTNGNTMDQVSCHQTLGAWNSNLPNQTWNGAPVPTVTVTDPQMRSGLPSGNGGGPTYTIPYNDSSSRILGVLFADGTRSVLFFGKKGLGAYCYGPGTDQVSLAGTPAPGGVDNYCYDPDVMGKGDHAYPYVYFVWAYDVNDYVASKQGLEQPWEVFPYEGWTFSQFGNATDLGGVAWDATTRRMYLAAPYADDPNNQPLIHVYQVGLGGGGDGGVTGMDAGQPAADGGSTMTDGGSSMKDAGTAPMPDGGTTGGTPGGCGCASSPAEALLALGLVLGLKRRRRATAA